MDISIGLFLLRNDHLQGKISHFAHIDHLGSKHPSDL